jgi:predicted NAD/FAD-binding protein
VIPRESRICVVGAGAGGLSAADYLRQQAYRHVTVLEQAGRVGGKCQSVTDQGRVYDLGAFWVAGSHTELRRLAGRLGLRLVADEPLAVVSFAENGTPRYRNFVRAVAAAAPPRRVAAEVVRYLWLRSRLGRVLDRPGFAQVSRHPELCLPVGEWLRRNRLTHLKTLMESLVTMLGYGDLEETPAAYALKFPTPRDLLNVRQQWPKKIVGGFQRLWEKVAAGLDVRLNTHIRRIERNEGIRVVLDTGEALEFDQLILACPLSADVLGEFLTLSTEEAALFSKVIYSPYRVTAVADTGLRLPSTSVGYLPYRGPGQPAGMHQQHRDLPRVHFYSLVDREGRITEEDVRAAIRHDLGRLGGAVSGPTDSHEERRYFPHVTGEDLAAGFYDRLEALQGRQRTFYVGGLMSMEFVGSVVTYSRQLVETHFAPA